VLEGNRIREIDHDDMARKRIADMRQQLLDQWVRAVGRQLGVVAAHLSNKLIFAVLRRCFSAS
jgi:hypothetical protein